MKKAISAATSAALLASLLATAVAPSAFAAVTVGSAGNVPVGGTSANNVSFQFTEQAIASLANGAGSFTVAICDAGGVTIATQVCTHAGFLSFSGTPSTAGSTGSLGASASIAGNVLTVNVSASDTGNIESIFVTGLKISAATGATTGAISATMSLGTGAAFTAPGVSAPAAFSAGGTASGFLSNSPALGTATANVNVTTTGCPFVSTTTAGAGSFAFAAGVAGTTAESLAGTTPGLVGTTEVLTITTAGGFTSAHNAGDVVTQTGACGGSQSLASPGTVVAAIAYSSAGNATVFPGETSQVASNLSFTEPSIGFLAAASTFTFKIATPGVVFSTAPTVSAAGTNEVQTVTLGGTVAAHTFTLTFGANTTSALASDTATAAQVQAALQGLASIGAGNAVVSGVAGGPFTVTFVGTLANTNVAQMTATALTGSTAVVATLVQGVPGNGMVLSAPVLSADRLSATVTVTTASTVIATVTLANILYDVASTVPAGTFVSVGLSTSAAQAVLPATQTNAVVFRGIAASATSPTVYIGENNQTAGVITFKEAAAGFFTDGLGTANNTFAICPSGVTYSFTLAPVASVTGGVAAGNIILRDGAAASTTNVVVGTQVTIGTNPNCYQWVVWTASTTASTIVIGAAPSAATGALINVTSDQVIGGVNANLFIGSSSFVTQLTLAATVQFANAMYRNQVAVTALSAPYIAPGFSGPAGNVQIAETGIGQLKAGQVICFQILWQAGMPQNTFMNSNDTADLPVATASGTGLVISPVTPASGGCTTQTTNPAVPAAYMGSFSFTVLQQSTAGDGKLVVSNLRDTVLTGAALGPVQLSVNAFDAGNVGGTIMDFHSTVINANIGTAPAAAAVTTSGTALGATKVGPFTVATKVAKLGKYVTWKFSGGSALVGKTVQIWVATKNSAGKWGAFALLTARTVDASGNAYFWWKTSSKAWISVRAGYLGTLSVATQARWL